MNITEATKKHIRSSAITMSLMGPGLIVMLADTDAGCLVTAAQSGAQWGYRLLPLQIILIPILFMVQELTIRLGTVTGQGHGELIRHHFGVKWAWFSCGTLLLACLGALISEFAGIAGVGLLFGIPSSTSMLITVGSMIVMIWSGSYRSVEKIAIFLGLFELAFFYVASRSHPDLTALQDQMTMAAMSNPKFLYLVTANIGAVIMPWMIFFQQSAIVEKKLGIEYLPMARWETAIGAVLTQLIMCAVLAAAAATIYVNGQEVSLDTVQQISDTLTPYLGWGVGRIIFAVGMTGAAMVAAIVVSLTAAWGVGEVAGYRRSLTDSPREAPWFYGTLTGCLILGGILVASEHVNLIRLSVGVEVLNAILLPVTLTFLFLLARNALPDQYRIKGVYGWVIGITMFCTSLFGVFFGITGLVN